MASKEIELYADDAVTITPAKLDKLNELMHRARLCFDAHFRATMAIDAILGTDLDWDAVAESEFWLKNGHSGIVRLVRAGYPNDPDLVKAVLRDIKAGQLKRRKRNAQRR